MLEEETAEVHRILAEMTSRIGEESTSIKAALDILAELDLQFAKARFAEDYNCVAVTLVENTTAEESESAAERRKIAAQGASPGSGQTRSSAKGAKEESDGMMSDPIFYRPYRATHFWS